MRQGLEIWTQNTNNHQQTWGVLGSALAAVRDFMVCTPLQAEGPGAVHFQIFDGWNEVGQGTVGYSGLGVRGEGVGG